MPKIAIQFVSGADPEDLSPPRTLCKTCKDLPYPMPTQIGSCCRIEMRPLRDGGYRFYVREPGSDDELTCSVSDLLYQVCPQIAV